MGAERDDEDRWIRWLKRRARRHGGDKIGDDAAVLPAGGPWAVTVDTQIAGVHFPPDLDAAVMARRLLAVNLSDLAAVGAEPAYALCALTTAPGLDLRRFFDGLLAGCRRHGVELVGGDLSRSQRPSAALTLIGRAAEGGGPARDAARDGDVLWLGGPVGESALGLALVEQGARMVDGDVRWPTSVAMSGSLADAGRRAVRRHLAPEPQLELGRWLAGRPRAAAIDVSDGLARDLRRLCQASGVGATVVPDALPEPPSARMLAAALDLRWLDLALGGGEDYVLLFTLPQNEEPPASFGAVAVGRVHQDRGVFLQGPQGREPLPDVGWDHLNA